VLHVVLLVGCAVTIYLACEWFVNAVEWLGVQLSVGPIAVGTILAAAGTALPESVVTLVAVLGRSQETDAIAVGAALAGPLVVGTIAYGVTGALLVAHRVRPAPGETFAGVDVARLARDQRWFLGIFAVKVGLGLVAFAAKPWLGLLFFAAYGAYVRQELREGTGRDSAVLPEPLKLQPGRIRPARWAVLVQTAVTLALVFGASQLFVGQLEWAGPALGLPTVVVTLLLSPLATELPEVMNAVIWVRQGKTQLALANISGAMMIQATVPSGIGLLFTPWLFDAPLVLAGLVTAASVGYLLWLLRGGRMTAPRLSLAAVFYGLFAAALTLIVRAG
jgi:cation:H+ antiporter